jgi:hypothetical protein
MTSRERCPICEAGGLEPSLELPGLSVRRCPSCGHSVAERDPPTGPVSDYHSQYDAGAFLDALRETRRRQAAAVVGAIRRQIPRTSHLVDFGAGRGWFLDACRDESVSPLAGVDTSELAVSGLRRAGFEAHRLPDGRMGRYTEALRQLSLPPRILTLLDVLEHFPPRDVSRILREILDACTSVQLVVVKVPSPGVLYRVARALGGIGILSPIRKLYQVGTWPPHFSYFSESSMEALLRRSGLAVAARFGDADFEPRSLAARTGARGRIPAAVLRVAGTAFFLAGRVIGSLDAAIFIARPSAAPVAAAGGPVRASG